MGRTLPTIVRALDQEREDWRHFRRALRKEDQEAFDALWRLARRHAAPSAMASRAVVLESAVMAMLVGLMRAQLEGHPPTPETDDRAKRREWSTSKSAVDDHDPPHAPRLDL